MTSSEQLTLEAHARRSDPETSHDAAASITSDTLRKAQSDVLACLTVAGPMTHDEILRAYRDNSLVRQSDSGIRTRVSELVDAGLVRDSGERRTLPSGRRAIVWERVPA